MINNNKSVQSYPILPENWRFTECKSSDLIYFLNIAEDEVLLPNTLIEDENYNDRFLETLKPMLYAYFKSKSIFLLYLVKQS